MIPMTHKELVMKAHRWVLRNAGCGVAFHELMSGSLTGEIADVIGFGNYRSVLIECKLSRSDFLKDKNKKFRANPELGMGQFRYYCCPDGIITINDLPQGWGLLLLKGRGIIKVWDSSEFEQRHFKNEHALMYSALRRLQIRGRVEEIYANEKQVAINI